MPSQASLNHSETSATLAERSDLVELQGKFTRDGRLRIPGILDEAFAAELHAVVSSWTQWILVTILGGQHRNLDAAQMSLLDPVKKAEFEGLVAAHARSGFQYLFDRYPLYDPEFSAPDPHPVLCRFRDLLKDGPLLDLVRRITGFDAIAFGDGQVTRYRNGHFLTQHTDYADGKNRVVAYVLGLTPSWSADFGGQLQFLDQEGSVEEVYVPTFNSLCLFKVPRPHLVSVVAPFVTASRLSITGWFRTA